MRLPRQVLEGIKNFILDSIEEHPNDLVLYVSSQLNYSASAVRRLVNQLIENKILDRQGAGRGTVYRLKTTDSRYQYTLDSELEEDVIWAKDLKKHFIDEKDNVRLICQYGCTEMINNVIDHSGSEGLSVYIAEDAKAFRIAIIDSGIGIFRKIQHDLGLENPNQSLLELAKGKFTSDPENHTGEGVFFTSRVCDQFAIISAGLNYITSEKFDQGLLDEVDYDFDGTFVAMQVLRSSDTTLENVFNQYASPDSNLSFHKTLVPLHLMQYEGESLLSRSQAKRAMSRVDRFTEVILDFTGVDMVGPAFVDQIFRVFQKAYPRVNLYVQGANVEILNRIHSITPEIVVVE